MRGAARARAPERAQERRTRADKAALAAVALALAYFAAHVLLWLARGAPY